MSQISSENIFSSFTKKEKPAEMNCNSNSLVAIWLGRDMLSFNFPDTSKHIFVVLCSGYPRKETAVVSIEYMTFVKRNIAF